MFGPLTLDTREKLSGYVEQEGSKLIPIGYYHIHNMLIMLTFMTIFSVTVLITEILVMKFVKYWKVTKMVKKCNYWTPVNVKTYTVSYRER